MIYSFVGGMVHSIIAGITQVVDLLIYICRRLTVLYNTGE